MEMLKGMMGETLLSLVLGVISLLGAYGVYLVRKGAAYLDAKARTLADEARRKLLTDALADVETLAVTTVGALEQTTAKALREGVKRGEVTKDALQELAARAFDEIKRSVAETARETISENLGSFDAYLINLIEAKVLAIKAATGK